MYRNAPIPRPQTLADFLLAPTSRSVIPVPCGSVTGFDGIDTNYRFDVYGIFDRPVGGNAVYIFAGLAGTLYRPLYIGRADFLRERLQDHERHGEAVANGGTHLLVHIPGTYDRIDYKEAEQRLIRCYAPPLMRSTTPCAASPGDSQR